MIKSQPVFGPVDVKRVFTQYARIIAQKAVRAALAPIVSSVVAANTLLEIDADRLLPEQKDLLTGNSQKLAELAVRTQDALEASLSNLPAYVHTTAITVR